MTVARLITGIAALGFLSCVVSVAAQPKLVFSVPFIQEARFSGFGPVAKVSLAGSEAHIVVDTGSAPTILMDFFVSSLSERSEVCVSGIEITISARSLGRRPCGVIKAIAPFKDAGLAGMLSPQQLYPTGLVVVDLSRARLSAYEMGDKDAATLLSELYPTVSFAELERFGWSLGAVLVRASWGARPEVLVDLDTGRPFTTFASDYIGHNSATRAGTASINAMGQRSENRETETAESLSIGRLTINNRSVRLMDKPRDAAGIAYGGLIGRDVLQSCVIAIPPRPYHHVYLGCES